MLISEGDLPSPELMYVYSWDPCSARELECVA